MFLGDDRQVGAADSAEQGSDGDPVVGGQWGSWYGSEAEAVELGEETSGPKTAEPFAGSPTNRTDIVYECGDIFARCYLLVASLGGLSCH